MKKMKNKTILFQILIFVLSLIFISFMIYFIATELWSTKYLWTIFFILFFVLVTIPYAILTLTYLLHDFNKTIIFDYENKEMIFKKGHYKTIINNDNIKESFQIKGKILYGSSRIRYDGWGYALIILKDHQQIFITNLICDPKEISGFLNIKFRQDIKLVPLIKKRH
jgi:hypothetical protein